MRMQRAAMQFDSFTFLLFFALVLCGYNLIRDWNARKWFLLGASYLFYAAWNPPFLLLLIASTTLDWWIAQKIYQSTDASARKRWITITLLLNLSVLGYFKYSRFLLGNFATMLASLGVTYIPPKLDIVLPIGISFYTFHSLSYCLDIYRGKFAPTQNWRDYALYVGFFPQLVAGPIVRFTQIREQIETARKTTVDSLAIGLAFLTLGLFEKIVLADSVFAPVADALFSEPATTNAVMAWAGVIAFTGQIFCDFAGYSTCAIGTALALGFVLPINFRNPYAALGFSDFWRRWHISLSTWLRDYLYIALGGNRKGEIRTYTNLMLTMLIGGLWHGAAWTFVIWGGLHGIYLSIERVVRERLLPTNWSAGMLLRCIYGIITLFAVMTAWIWFRSPTFETGWTIQRLLFNFPNLLATLPASNIDQQLAVAVFAILILVQWIFRNCDPKQLLQRTPAPLLGIILGALLAMIVLSPGDNHAFIYFQF